MVQIFLEGLLGVSSSTIFKGKGYIQLETEDDIDKVYEPGVYAIKGTSYNDQTLLVFSNRTLTKFLLVFFDNLNNILFRIGYQSCVFLLFFQNVCVNDPVLQYCFKCVVCWSIYSLFCAFFMHKIFL